MIGAPAWPGREGADDGRSPRGDQCHRQRGGVLFEVVLALALFGGAAAFTLAAARSAFGVLERARTRHVALDLARTKLAELEAGLAAPTELRGEIEFPSRPSPRLEPSPAAMRWHLELTTQRSEFSHLSLVQITVTELLPEGSSQVPLAVSLRQLMRLGHVDDVDAPWAGDGSDR